MKIKNIIPTANLQQEEEKKKRKEKREVLASEDSILRETAYKKYYAKLRFQLNASYIPHL